MDFKVTVLGSGSALPSSSRFCSAHLFQAGERFYLIDCAEGTQYQLRRFRLSFSKINQIFLSHLHGDHVFGLYGLLSTFELLGRRGGLTIIGPAGTEEYLHYFRTHFGQDLSYPLLTRELTNELPEVVFADKQIEVTALPLTHKIPTYGYLFREKPKLLNLRKEALLEYKPGIAAIQSLRQGKDLVTESGQIVSNRVFTYPPYKQRTYCYITDTICKESLTPHLQGCDLLYHESTFLHNELKLARQTCHSTAVQAAQFALRAKARKLLLGHFSQRYKNEKMFEDEAREIFPESHAVTDGDAYEVPLERETYE